MDGSHFLDCHGGDCVMFCSTVHVHVGHRVMVAHDLQADDEKVQKKVAKKLARQQVWILILTLSSILNGPWNDLP